MILYLTSVWGDERLDNIPYKLYKIEDAFDALNLLVTVGQTLLHAHLVDEEHVLELPVAAFDGKLISDIIAELEKEWQSLLSEPARQVDETKKRFWQQQIDYLANRIQVCQRMISTLENLLLRANSWRASPLKISYIARYSRYIKKEKLYLVKLAQFQEVAKENYSRFY